jgi:transcriptional regulator with XRE-family HTH domain
MSVESDGPQPVRIFVKEWRQYHALTMDQLAGRIGISSVALARIEGGHAGWDSTFLAAGAQALGLKPADLLRDPGD